MIQNKINKLQELLNKHPKLKGKFLGLHHDNKWRSRINDGWFDCDEFWIELDDVIEFLNHISSDSEK